MGQPRATNLRVLVRAIADARRSSVVILEVTRTGDTMAYEDAGSLRQTDGQEAVLLALCHGLRELLINTEAALAVVQQHDRAAAQLREPPS